MTTKRRETGQPSRDSHQPQQTSATPKSGKSPNEGEGSRSADRDYVHRTERFIDSGRVEESAGAAERAIDSSERGKLEEAERIGRQHRKS